MAAPHAILERAGVPGDGLFLLQRQPSRLRTPPRIDSPIPMDPEEEEEEAAESEFERNTRGLLDEIFADAPPHLARAGPSISRRDAVQSLSDDDDAMMPVRAGSNASIDSDFSMSLGPSRTNSNAAQDASTGPASSSDAPSQGSEVGEILWDSQPILDQDWGSMDPPPFVPPLLPPLETREQIDARERNALKAKVDRLEAIAAEHAAVAREQQQQIDFRRAEEQRAVSSGGRADKANPAMVGSRRLNQNEMNRYLGMNKSNQLTNGLNFYFMTPRVYTERFHFKPHKREDYMWSVKLDGNRALWDGFRQVLRSKSGTVEIRPPHEWAKHLPTNCYLDGELYVPYAERVNGTATEFASSLHEVAPIWKRHRGTLESKAHRLWLKLQFHAFDIVGADMYDRPLEDRLFVLEATLRRFGLTQDNPVLKRVFVGFLRAETQEGMHKEVARLLAHYAKLGAEGIVIKDLKSVYRHTSDSPSISWLKVKHLEDVEAKVVELIEATPYNDKGVRIELADATKPKQIVTFANDNLIAHNRLKVDDIVRVDYMPVEPRPGAAKLRTPIIRAIVQDGTTWDDVKRRQREKEEEARHNY